MKRIAIHSVFFVTLISTLLCSNALAETTATWTGFARQSATGILNGIPFTVTTSSTAPFIAVVDDRLSEGRGWDAELPLSRSAEAIVTANVSGGDSQIFSFDKPIDEGLLYIENFDTSSIANITANGGDQLELVAGSESIIFGQRTANAGTLRTTNPTSNGEGDAVLLFGGGVSTVTINYARGGPANGVFYSLAVGTVEAVPEPVSSAMALILALVPLALRNRR